MSRALIGYTGFVGGNLDAQAAFEAKYHSRNIEEIRGREFELVVSAGAPAVKWKANQEPEADAAAIRKLTDCLATVRAEKFVLISTVDVYPVPVKVDEGAAIDVERCGPYGRHRKQLEEFVQSRFDAVVMRLPGLFGEGLKKNVIYDLMHGHRVEQIDPRAWFQFYSLDWLWWDVERALERGIEVLNVATEPVHVAALAREAFGVELELREEVAARGEPVRYNFRSRHAAAWKGQDGYLYDRVAVMRALETFVGRRLAVNR